MTIVVRLMDIVWAIKSKEGIYSLDICGYINGEQKKLLLRSRFSTSLPWVIILLLNDKTSSGR